MATAPAAALSPDAFESQLNQSLLLAAGGGAPKKNRWWVYALIVAVVVAIIAGLVAIAMHNKAANPNVPTWKRVNGVESTYGANFDLQQYHGITSYDQCFSLVNTGIDKAVNFFTYNPTSQVCALKIVPDPTSTRPNSSVDAGIYSLPKSSSSNATGGGAT